MTVEIPERMRGLPHDKHDRVVPWFVAFIDGQPDHRVIREGGIADALRWKKCWLCGHPLGRFATFAIGPMCAVNRVSAEPPSHRDCVEYAVKVCPFLTRPSMTRREHNLPEDRQAPAGTMIARNPGVMLTWTTRSWKPFRAPGGILFDVGDPVELSWWREGRTATRKEILTSIETGLPELRRIAETEDGGPEALDAQVAQALELVPAGSP